MAEDSAAAAALRETRDKLCGLLEESDLYDTRAVLQRCAHTELWDEQVVLHSKVRPSRFIVSRFIVLFSVPFRILVKLGLGYIYYIARCHRSTSESWNSAFC